jgi:hypothetical protein
MFPFLQSTGMSSEDYEKLQTRLYLESVDIAGAFGVMFNAFFQSIKEREMSVEEVVATLKAFGAFTPVYKRENQPLLRDELNSLDLKRASMHSVRLIILDYCSFFNYRLFRFLVGAQGTTKDKQKLQQYEAKFNEYAKRRVFECPPELGKPCDKFNANMSIKLDDHYEGCTLNQLKLLEADFCGILNITNLKLCHAAPGCLQLTFQLPQFITKQIFPLSREQEKELLALNIVRVICGDYCFSAKVRYHFNYILLLNELFIQKEVTAEPMIETTTGLTTYHTPQYAKSLKFFLLDVASMSDLVLLQNADVLLTSNAKKDNERILILEAKLQEHSRKINDTERQQERERENKQRVFDEVRMMTETLNLKAEATAAEEQMEREEQIILWENLRDQLKELKEKHEELMYEIQMLRVKMRRN